MLTDRDGAPEDHDEALRILAALAGPLVGQHRAPHAGQPAIDPDPMRAEARYRALVEQIPAVTFMASLGDTGLHGFYVSPQIEELLGFTQQEWLGDPVLWYRQLHPDDRQVLNDEFARGCTSGGPFRAECRLFARDGRIVWVHAEARFIRDEHDVPVVLQGVGFDITQTKESEQVVRRALREKDILLQEVHHRVKNNLQITSSLLKMQADRLDDGGARRALQDGQDRIQAMALVHELLYRTTDFTGIDFADYLRDLVSHLVGGDRIRTDAVRVTIDAEPLHLGVDAAIPCGLIVNELVANALRHAFPDRGGTILIALRRDGGSCVLSVADDGVGWPASFDPSRARSLGLRLVASLSQQLGGEIEMDRTRASGVEIRLRFPCAAEGGGGG